MSPLPSAQLWALATGHMLPRCLQVMAELGVADHLGESPLGTSALATAAGVHPGALGRTLRLLASAGVFEAHGDLWAHNELSRLLRSDHPQTMRPYLRMLGGRLFWSAAGELEHAVRSGATAVGKLAPEGMWAYFSEHPEEGQLFDAAMTSRSNADIAFMIPSLDFTRYESIADVGGGRGNMLTAVLAAAPTARGVLFDRPEVVADVAPRERMRIQGGDFFKESPPAVDAYIVSRVLHDWADTEAVAILRSIRSVAPSGSELLILESILPETPEPHHTKVLDIIMLLMTGGHERTEREYQMLLDASGFRLDRVVATAGPVSVIVGVPA